MPSLKSLFRRRRNAESSQTARGHQTLEASHTNSTPQTDLSSRANHVAGGPEVQTDEADYQIYHSLNPTTQEIRVLALQPATGSTAISCYLHVVSLIDRPQPIYRTLSYTWGGNDNPRTIFLNGEVVTVTENLFGALVALRHVEDVEVLWIDALCINQEDIGERSQQVGLMQAIYSLCSEVVVWLGKVPNELSPTTHATWRGNERDEGLIWLFWSDFEAERENSGLDATFHAFATLRLLTEKHIWELPLFRDKSGAGFVYPVPFPEYQHRVFLALEPFVNSPWWDRLWTHQESVLPSNMSFLYGPITAQFDMIAASRLKFAEHQKLSCCLETYDSNPYNLRVLLQRFWVNIFDIWAGRYEKDIGHRSNVCKILREFRHRKATDDRDKVFGLLGLVTAWYGGETCVPDYTLSTEDVYLRIAVTFTLSSKSLWMMHCSLEKLKYPNLPSWVPDWTNLDLSADDSRRNPRYTECYCAMGETYSGARMYGDRILGLDGVRCDSINAVGQPFLSLRTTADVVVHCEWFLLAGMDVDPDRSYPAGGTCRNAYWRCLSGDCINGDDSADPRRAIDSDYDAFVEFFVLVRSSPFHGDGLNAQQREAWLLDERFKSFGHLDQSDGGHFTVRASKFSGAAEANTMDRAFFVTEKGYMGVGPSGTKPGDEVWCFYGGRTPFVVRPTGTEHFFVQEEQSRALHSMVGDAFVHGFMDREALAWAPAQTEWVYLI